MSNDADTDVDYHGHDVVYFCFCLVFTAALAYDGNSYGKCIAE